MVPGTSVVSVPHNCWIQRWRAGNCIDGLVFVPGFAFSIVGCCKEF